MHSGSADCRSSASKSIFRGLWASILLYKTNKNLHYSFNVNIWIFPQNLPLLNQSYSFISCFSTIAFITIELKIDVRVVPSVLTQHCWESDILARHTFAYMWQLVFVYLLDFLKTLTTHTSDHLRLQIQSFETANYFDKQM